MPMLDVGDVVLDPMFCDFVDVLRRQNTVDEHGRNSIKTTKLSIVAVVTFASSPSMQREPDYELAKNAITVHSPTKLFDPSSGLLPDIVVYQGQKYIVKKANGWSNYGAGFFASDCTMMDLINQPAGLDDL